MSPSRKTHPSRRHRQTRRRVLAAIVVLLIITVSLAAYLSLPNAKSTTNNQSEPTSPPQSSAFTAFTEHYLSVMQNLNSTQTREEMASMLKIGDNNQTDLFAWEKTKMTFIDGPCSSCEDPFRILENKEGICLQWSIVSVSACLALGYQSRLVVAADTSSWSFIHVWAEDYYNGTWVHVDPSDGVWNNPSRYQKLGVGHFRVTG